MRITRAFAVAGFCAAATFAPTLSGCGSDGGVIGPGNAIVTAWDVTSFMVQGTDVIAGGMTFAIDLAPGGTYTFDITNDLVGICTPGPDCSDTGPYTYTATTLTFDPGTPDEGLLTYTIQGATATLTGTIGGFPVTITLQKQ
ncbi:MAG: hypothetical protein SGJ01_11515 [Gemmatimonadota bacterium]|nr:hypothetical protein [Gemmatimonadota bacterium]